MSRTNALGQILCYGCNNPIHVTQFAGAVNVNGQSEFFCNSLPCLLTIADIQGDNMEVKKQTQIVVADGNIRVTHTTNTKKRRVSFSGFGQAGHIKVDNLDRVIDMLIKLKGEIENENV